MVEAVKIKKEDWAIRALNSHEDVFGSDYLDEAANFDFALVSKQDGQEIAFCTVKELDRDSAMLVFGGTFSDFRNKKLGYEGFSSFINQLKLEYKFIGFLVRTNNFPMLKLGINEKFELAGMKRINGVPFAEFLLDTGRK